MEEKQIRELIFAIGYTLDSIDVRANDPRRFEAKQKAKRILERLVSDLTPQPATKEPDNYEG